ASIAAHSEGRNLQKWHQNLVMSCPANGSVWEQLIGRTHREGQLADKVTFDIVVACNEQLRSLHRAVSDARYIQDTTGQPQKLIGEGKWKAFFQQ
ncbi:MAG: helicase, partial [Myxococcaceae bacterium]